MTNSSTFLRWSRKLERESTPSILETALRYANQQNLQVSIGRIHAPSNYGLTWSVTPLDNPDFPLETFQTKKQALVFCEEMDWIVHESTLTSSDSETLNVMINTEENRKVFTKGYQHALADMSGHARSIDVSDTLSVVYNQGYAQGKLDALTTEKVKINAATAWENAIKENSYLDKEIPKEIAFFTCCDAEEKLIYTEPDEAIETFLDGFIEPNTHGIEGLPETVTLYGFEPMEVIPSGCNPLDNLLDYIDDEYGNPEGPNFVATEKMKAAEKAFIAAVVAEYHPWAHERTWECEVDVAAWVKKNMPEWLE